MVHKKYQALITLITLAVFVFISCSSNPESEIKTSEKTLSADLFNAKCALCHGEGGDKQLSGAKKLTESVLSKSEIEVLVTDGLRQMPAFSTQLTLEEIKSVSEYVYSIRNK